jgi:2-oxoglutarate ferredoxin oxidoreductase subunit gamma
MKSEIVISGFGGQGALFAGQVLAHAALAADRHTTWYPAYGPEMRGGTAHCVVTVSDEPIGSPVVRHPQAAIVMNIPSLDRYEPLVRPGGVLVINGSLVDRPARRRDITVITVPADEVARELGDVRLANMVLVGALLARLDLLGVDLVETTLRQVVPARRRHLVEANVAALRRGAALADAAVPADRTLAPA